MTKPAPKPAVGGYRWFICSLLFAATTINYMDRTVLGVLGPTLQYQVFHWTDRDFAIINAAFKAAYAIGMISMGAIADRLGTRIGYALAIAVWSVFGMLHALVRPAYGVVGFALARVGLAFGEAGNYPCAVKTVAEWFPRKERTFASGLFNAGSNVGAILAPVVIPLVVAADGSHWQVAFLTTGAFSALWVAAWLKFYSKPSANPRLSKTELDYIQSDDPTRQPTLKPPWTKILGLRETWAFVIAKTTDAAWWFYMFWGGKFLYDRFGLNLKSLALPLIAIYVLSDLGGIAGGWFSTFQMARGRSANRAIKTTLLISALCTLPAMLITQIGTRFNADGQFYERVAASRLLPDSDLQALQSLSGRSFRSAKEFLSAAHGALATNATSRSAAQSTHLEEVLIASARSDNLYWLAVALVALAAIGHQAWSANLFSVVMNVFPQAAVASVTGVGGMFGATASMIADLTLGELLTHSGPSAYLAAFLFGGSVYLVTLGIIQILMPKMTPLDGNLRPIPSVPAYRE